MNNIEWYKSNTGGLYIAIGKQRIGLSQTLFKALDKPKYIQLGYWDKEKSIIIKPCNENSEYRLEIKNSKYPPKINSKGFIEFLLNKGVKIKDKTKRYKARLDDKNKIYIVKMGKEMIK